MLDFGSAIRRRKVRFVLYGGVWGERSNATVWHFSSKPAKQHYFENSPRLLSINSNERNLDICSCDFQNGTNVNT